MAYLCVDKSGEYIADELPTKAWLKAKNEMCMFELEMILGSNFIEDFVKYLEE